MTFYRSREQFYFFLYHLVTDRLIQCMNSITQSTTFDELMDMNRRFKTFIDFGQAPEKQLSVSVLFIVYHNQNGQHFTCGNC